VVTPEEGKRAAVLRRCGERDLQVVGDRRVEPQREGVRQAAAHANHRERSQEGVREKKRWGDGERETKRRGTACGAVGVGVSVQSRLYIWRRGINGPVPGHVVIFVPSWAARRARVAAHA
jgi:hypothetical protein